MTSPRYRMMDPSGLLGWLDAGCAALPLPVVAAGAPEVGDGVEDAAVPPEPCGPASCSASKSTSDRS